MRIIETKVYQFDELSNKAKEKAREWLRDDNGVRGNFEVECITEDAEHIGLVIRVLDDQRPNQGKFSGTALECAKKVTAAHGKNCETYKTVMRYIDALEAQDEDIIEDTEHEFLNDLLEDYRIMLNQALEYVYSDDAIDEDMRANEYEFTEEGKQL